MKPDMNPRQYEEMIAAHFRRKGYAAQLTPHSNDYGVDCIAERPGERIAIQAKMYGRGLRAVNRKTIMELRGAMHYFDCNKAILVTDGELLRDAWQVAAKLGVEVMCMEAPAQPALESPPDDATFEAIWTKHILPLAGKKLARENGKSNTILEVDWSGVKRLTSSGRRQKISIEIFRYAVNKLLMQGHIRRACINDEYPERASSGICLILSQVPTIRYDKRSASLVWDGSKCGH